MPRLTYKDNMFWFQCTYDEKHLANQARLRWYPEQKCFGTTSKDKAKLLLPWADQKTKDILSGIPQEDPSIDYSSIPAPSGLNYYNFQKESIKFMHQRAGSLLALDMGLGKTICVMGYINFDKQIKRVLVVCPASLKINWQREAEKWLTRDLTVGVVNSKKWVDTDIVIINYDILHNHRNELRRFYWDLRVVDECHFLKSGSKTRRGREVLGHWDGRSKAWKVTPIHAKKRVFLSGTPMLNRPVELWPLIRALDPDTWGDYYRFVYRYCAAQKNRWGLDVRGASNTEELGRILKSTIMLRKTKTEALPDLPPKVRQVLELPANGHKELIAEEMALWNKVKENIDSIDIAKNEEEFVMAVQNLKESRDVLFQEMSRIRKLTAMAKLPMVIEHLKNVVEQEDKVVVFAYHIDVIDSIHAEFPNSVVLYGKTRDKQAPVDKFMNDNQCNMFIGNLKAAGVGITLTAASHVVFAEIDWTPSVVTQAEDRCARIGQNRSVLVQHLVFEDSLDSKMAKMIVDKQRVIDSVMESSVSVNTVLEKEVEIEKPKMPVISDYCRISTHNALKVLSSMCDGAVSIDGVGFNKIDSTFGKSLAKQLSLSDRQVIAAKQLLIKYKKQLSEIDPEFPKAIWG